MSTRELLCWMVAFFAMANAARRFQYGAHAFVFVLDGVELIAWGCALLLIVRDKEPARASSQQIGSLVGLGAFVILLPSASAMTLALIPFGLFVSFGRGWTSAQHRAGFVFLSLAAQRLMGKIVPILFGDTILRLDTAVAGTFMRLFVPGSTWTGNVLKPPHDVGVVVGMPCSSFANLSLVMLCFVSLYAVDGGRPSRRAAAAVAGVCLLVVLVNTVRLVATAHSLESYKYWHDGAGAEIFSLFLTVLTITLCSISSRWASAWRGS
jgi:exosortase/archaeosortase family protein